MEPVMEAKLLQHLAFREQIPTCRIFLDLRKAFDAMDRERCLSILGTREWDPAHCASLNPSGEMRC